MRGPDTFTESLFSFRKLDDFVPASHPLRSIRIMANEALAKMDRLFAGLYEADIKGGCPSIAPEKLLRAMLSRNGSEKGRSTSEGSNCSARDRAKFRHSGGFVTPSACLDAARLPPPLLSSFLDNRGFGQLGPA